MSDKLIYRDLKDRVAFVWGGGPYIDVFWSDALAIRGLVGDDAATPFTNINMWDHATDSAAIPFTKHALWRAANEWLRDNEGDLGGYLEHSL